MRDQFEHYYHLEDFGVDCLNVIDAACLLLADSVCGYYGNFHTDEHCDHETHILLSGLPEELIEIIAEEGRDDFRSMRHHPEIAGILDKYIKIISSAIERGSLEAALEQRNFPDDTLNLEKTLISASVFDAWLNARDYVSGDVFQKFHKGVNSTVYYIVEMVTRGLAGEAHNAAAAEFEGMDPSDAYRHYATRIAELELRLSRLKEKSVSDQKEPGPKSRNAYLKTIRALSETLLEGLTNKPSVDAGALVTAMDSAGIKCPVGERALTTYLKEAAKLED